MVVPALIQFMQGGDLARATGAYALSQIKSSEAEAAVLEILPKLIHVLNSNDPKVTMATLVALKGIGLPACLASLEEMSQTNPTLRNKGGTDTGTDWGNSYIYTRSNVVEQRSEIEVKRNISVRPDWSLSGSCSA